MRFHATLFCALSALTITRATAVAAPADHGAAVTLPHISIVSIGSGSPVVLIPGLGSPREVWGSLVPELAKSHQLILVEVNGFGGSAPGANLSAGVLDGMVADLSGYLMAKGIDAAPVIGHSMGGLAALKLALAHPSAVKRLMIVDALPFFGALVDEQATPDAVRPIAEMMQRKVASAYGKPADRDEAADNVKGLSLKPVNVAAMVEWSLEADPRVTGELLFEDMTTDLRPQLGGLKVPITLLYPVESEAQLSKRLSFYQRQYAKAPTVTFESVRDSAHMVMLDQPGKFAAAVTRFLDAR